MKEINRSLQALLQSLPTYDAEAVQAEYQRELDRCEHQFIVLDDDPTGVQTVWGVYVYTKWDEASIDDAIQSGSRLVYILTNSRGLPEEESRALHEKIARRIATSARKHGRKIVLISRSDSTLRGHYPMEPEVLKDALRAEGVGIDAEILCPFFLEGGRYTADDVHYVADGDTLIPAGMTEFAHDKVFGYRSSDLREWIEEKSGGAIRAERVQSISLEMLRSRKYDEISHILERSREDCRIVLNAVSYQDIRVFATAFFRVIGKGQRGFLLRSAAAIPKVLGGVPDRPLLSHSQLIDAGNGNGGLVIVGSHVQKTTRQLEVLRRELEGGLMRFLEFKQHLVLDELAFEDELQRTISNCEESLTQGQSVTLYTRRERFDPDAGSGEAELRIAAKISEALTRVVAQLGVRPSFIVAKGGITSSDIGTKGLSVRKALVLGQIIKGVPVWLTGAESKFPDMPYIIFPGNVGNDCALLEAVNILRQPAGSERSGASSES